MVKIGKILSERGRQGGCGENEHFTKGRRCVMKNYITRKQSLDLNAALYFRSELLQLGKCSLNADEFQAAKSSYLDMMSAEGFNTQIVEMIDVQNKFLLLRRGTSRTWFFGG